MRSLLTSGTTADIGLLTSGGGDMTFAADVLAVNVNEMRSPQVSGTPATWRVPATLATSGVTLPTCSTSADAGRIIYSDDTDDALAGVLCVCRANAAGTYGWIGTDFLTACPDP